MQHLGPSSSFGRLHREFFSQTEHPQKIVKSHGTMKSQSIFPRVPKNAQTNSLLTLSNLLEVNDIRGSNNQENCLICSVASILGKKCSDITGENSQKATFFGMYLNKRRSSGISFDDQVNGVKMFIVKNLPGAVIKEFGFSRDHFREFKSFNVARREMMTYPLGTKFLVYSDDGLQHTHWVSAEKDLEGISFYDFQKKLSVNPSNEVSSGVSSQDRSSLGVFSTHSSEQSFNASEIQFEEFKTPTFTTQVINFYELPVRESNRVLDTLPIKRNKPYPVMYDEGERYLLDLVNVGFLSIQVR